MAKSTAPHQQTYFQQLRFDPSLARSLVAGYLSNIRLVVLLIISIILLGIVAYTNLPKRLNPEVQIPIVTVVTVLPGASAKDVEQLVSMPLEDEVRSLKGIDTVTTRSQENISVMTVQFVSTVNGDQARDDVQSAISAATLPNSAQEPSVRLLDFEDVPVWTFALTGSDSYPDLMRAADQLRQQLEELSRIDRVVTTGFDRQEVTVQLSPAKLSQYQISPFQLSDALKKARASYPAGQVSTATYNFALSIDPSIETIADIRQLALTIDGRVVRLGELATVQERSVPLQPQTLLAAPAQTAQPAVLFYVYKTTASNIDSAGSQVQTQVDQFLAQNTQLSVTTVNNTSQEITDQFSDLLGEFRSTILLVFITLLLFLGLRQALISLLTVPLTFLSAFFLMQFFGMSINFLTLFAFLLSLGLLVDDTIVVVSAMTSYAKLGKFTPWQTGLLVWRDTIVPIWSTTITTIWAFLPLLLASGIIGEFIKPIPIVVTATMLSSTAIAVLITLPLMIVLLKPRLPRRVIILGQLLLGLGGLAGVLALTWGSPLLPLATLSYLLLAGVVTVLGATLRQRAAKHWQGWQRHQPQLGQLSQALHRLQDHGVVNLERFGNWYRRQMLWVLASQSRRRGVLIAVVIYSIFAFAMLPLGFVRNEFFPRDDAQQFSVNYELPSGTTLAQTRQAVEPTLSQLTQLPGVEFVTAEIGRRGGANNLGGSLGDASNVIHFSVRLRDRSQRSQSSQEIAATARRQLAAVTTAQVTVEEDSGGGPPAGADLQLQLAGNDLGTLEQLADQVVTYLQAQPGVNNVEKSVTESTGKVRFIPDPAKLSQENVTVENVAFALRLYASGFTLDQFPLDPNSTEKTDVVFRSQVGAADLAGLSQVQVTASRGRTVPVSALGEFIIEPNPTSIVRENYKRTVTVTAAVSQGFSVSEANQQLEKYADQLPLPAGYSWQTGGVNEENQRSVTSILQAMGLSAVLIMVTMVIQFQSFRQAAIVLMVIPLAVSSVFLAFALTGTPLSFPALIGVLSLFGIVVTNSMFIVDKINLNLKQGIPFAEAIADAGASRMEPIILTKLSTVLGLLPITLAEPIWRGLGGAIISGLLVASTIMLLFIPVLYYAWMPEKNVRRAPRRQT